MKRLTGILFVVFLCLMSGALAVYAEDRSVESSPGITFEDGDPEETEETEEPTKSGGQESQITTASGKSSLPQTGQKAGMVLPAAGCAILIFAGWWKVERYRISKCHGENVPS